MGIDQTPALVADLANADCLLPFGIDARHFSEIGRNCISNSHMDGGVCAIL